MELSYVTIYLVYLLPNQPNKQNPLIAWGLASYIETEIKATEKF